MKTRLLATMILLILPTTALYAVDAHHPDKQGQGQSMSSQQSGDMTMEKMQAHMQKMREQMDKIRATEDPDKRAELFDEHMKSMHEGMKMMRGMGGSMMMGSKQQGAPMNNNMAMRMNRMEQHMDMMQMMMDQMVQSQDAMKETP
jgi:hypothetical protein